MHKEGGKAKQTVIPAHPCTSSSPHDNFVVVLCLSADKEKKPYEIKIPDIEYKIKEGQLVDFVITGTKLREEYQDKVDKLVYWYIFELEFEARDTDIPSYPGGWVTAFSSSDFIPVWLCPLCI